MKIAIMMTNGRKLIAWAPNAFRGWHRAVRRVYVSSVIGQARWMGAVSLLMIASCHPDPMMMRGGVTPKMSTPAPVDTDERIREMVDAMKRPNINIPAGVEEL